MIYLVAKTFTCGVLMDSQGLVTHTAPIVKYMKGWSKDQVLSYCEKRGWQASIYNETSKEA